MRLNYVALTSSCFNDKGFYRIRSSLSSFVPCHCSLVWGNCCDSLKEKLRKLQNRAARVITGDNYDTRSKDILQKLNWKNLSERKQQKAIAYVSKAIAGNCPENISKKFEKSYSERYDLRNNNKFLSLPKSRTNSMVRTFGYAVAKIWNENNKLE